jgi:hypothetical protein
MNAKADILNRIRSSVLPADIATTGGAFGQGIQSGYLTLQGVFNQESDSAAARGALSTVFGELRSTTRQRRILEMCAWPIFDKPALPHAKDERPEFLWLFAFPFVVTLSEAAICQPLLLSDEGFPAREALEQIDAARMLNKDAVLSAFPTMLTRESIHLYGPHNLAKIFVQAEMEDPNVTLQMVPYLFDSDIESGRVVSLFFVVAARLPVGETVLFQDKPPQALYCNLEKLVFESLSSEGVPVEAVTSGPFCSMTHTLLRCDTVGAHELQQMLALAKEHYPEMREVLVQFLTSGRADILGVLENGTEICITPTLAYAEPNIALVTCIDGLCRTLSIKFRGGFSSAIDMGARVH